MTVKQLIAQLKKMPQDTEVKVEILSYFGRSTSATVEEIFEGKDLKTNKECVTIQGFDI